MTDIAQIVNYEELYPLEIKHPVTDAPIGLTIWVRSAGSEAAKAIYRRQGDKQLLRGAKNKTPKAEVAEREELERVAGWTAKWEWKGDLNFHGEKPEHNERNVVRVLDELGWIYSQVREAALDLSNFSKASQES